MRTLPVVVDGGRPGAENMRLDADLLRRCADGETRGLVRVYWFAPRCLSLGRMQPDADVDRDACARDGIDVVRRPSGGRAVLHDDEVTYAVVCRVDDPWFGGDVMTSCARIHRAVAAGLARLGVVTTAHAVTSFDRRAMQASASGADCFARASAHELLDGSGHKLVGSAQARRAGALLQHGSVLLSAPGASSYLGDSARRGVGVAGAEHARATPGLRALAGRSLAREEVALAVAAGFEEILSPDALDTTA
jgi:lipoate-protein ligase A